MFLSEVTLKNWRSYADVTFEFVEPGPSRSLVLVGAMNGHGKTSFLMALYLGLFGRFGLRYADGFQDKTADLSSYRKAVPQFRRRQASPDDPTEVTICLKPSTRDREDRSSVEITRRWHFTPAGDLRQSDAGEEVEIFHGEVPVPVGDLDAAHDQIKRLLFEPRLMPAFFFDGEQAQQLIQRSGDGGVQQSVEVLFGTKVLKEVRDQMRKYIRHAAERAGGNRETESLKQELVRKRESRDVLEDEIDDLRERKQAAASERAIAERRQSDLQTQLARLGGDQREATIEAHTEFAAAEKADRDSNDQATEMARALGLPLALKRHLLDLKGRIEAEAALEAWENQRDHIAGATDRILKIALPEPAGEDPLLGHLNPNVRRQVRERFVRAVEAINNPKPEACADDYLLGFARGGRRELLSKRLEAVAGQGRDGVRASADGLRDAGQRLEDARAKLDRLENQPDQVERISDELTEVGEEIKALTSSLNEFDNGLKERTGRLANLNAEIERETNKLKQLEPEAAKIAIAERVQGALSDIEKELAPMALRKLQDSVTEHFRDIADRRYKKRVVHLGGGAPKLVNPNAPESSPAALVEGMSGFERRAFGVAFSLALAEVTGLRVPLIIDTPLGNADSEYRARLLDHLTAVDLDQVILLVHDAEVTDELVMRVRSKTAQKFLVEFDGKTGASRVHNDKFLFGGAV